MVIGSAVVGSATKNASPKASSTITAAPSTVTVPSTVTAQSPVTQTTTVQAAAPDPVVAETTQAGPKTAFSDGTYLVGTDIQPGSYKSSGPDTGGIGMCYWARLKDDSGSNIIANNVGDGPSRFTTKKGEYVEIAGCSFTKT
jgi:hypothetical protein